MSSQSSVVTPNLMKNLAKSLLANPKSIHNLKYNHQCYSEDSSLAGISDFTYEIASNFLLEVENQLNNQLKDVKSEDELSNYLEKIIIASVDKTYNSMSTLNVSFENVPFETIKNLLSFKTNVFTYDDLIKSTRNISSVYNELKLQPNPEFTVLDMLDRNGYRFSVPATGRKVSLSSL